MKKETIFKIITISIPFLLVIVFEIALRLSGYGENYQLFNKVKVENRPDYLIMNSTVGKKYFKNKDFQSDNQSDLFLKTKTDSTFRIFVHGASTVVGFPFYHGGSFPRMLKHRLAQTFPDKNIEVINTGITAVNSYTLLDLTDEIIDQDPDLILIYAGHNEYYGALGVGASSSFGSHPRLIRIYLILKKFRFFQLLDNVYSKISSPNSKQPKIGETTLMEVMAKEQRIPYNSKVYHAGLKQFENNIEKILCKYKKNNIPVILSTIVCNEKDIKPFISDSIIDTIQFIRTLEQKDSEANKLALKNAMAAYTLGHYYLEDNQDSAKKYLHLAKELDLLRFRGPGKINDIIKDLAQKYNFPILDMEDLFLSHSPQNIIGNELLSEHVHPNIKGYFLMADAFYMKIKSMNILSDWQHYISFDEAYLDMPITEIDSIRGKLVIDDLKKSWPYDLSMSGERPISPYYLIRNPTYEQQCAINIYMNKVAWKDVMVQAYDRYNQDRAYGKALRVAQSLIFDFPEQAEVYRLAGTMCLKLDFLEKAAFYFSKFNQLENSSSSAQQLAAIYIKLNKIELAKKTLLQVKNRGINDEEINDLINETSEILEQAK